MYAPEPFYGKYISNILCNALLQNDIFHNVLDVKSNIYQICIKHILELSICNTMSKHS